VRGLALHRLERHLSSFSPEARPSARGAGEGRAPKSYLVKLRLALPSAGPGERGPARATSPSRCARLFADLERQLKRHMAHLRREEIWRRKQRREALREIKLQAEKS